MARQNFKDMDLGLNSELSKQLNEPTGENFTANAVTIIEKAEEKKEEGKEPKEAKEEKEKKSAPKASSVLPAKRAFIDDQKKVTRSFTLDPTVSEALNRFAKDSGYKNASAYLNELLINVFNIK